MNSIKILILEHDLNDLELLLHTLKKSDLDYVTTIVETREKYEEALYDFKPDVILSDFTLPTFDGLAAYKIKQEVSPETPFIIVSGTIGEENAVQLIKTGVTDYTLKEKIYQVITKIQRALNETGERAKKRIAERELAEQAELTRNILESITDAFASVDRNWLIKYWNKEAENILGIKRQEIIGENLLDMYLDSISPKFYTEIHQVMNEGTAASFEEYFESRKIWLNVNVYPSKDGISVFFKDITESKRVESNNNLQKEVLEHYTKQGSTIESTIKLLMEGIRRIHPELLCSLLKVSSSKLYNWGYSHLPDSFIAATEGTNIAVGSECCGTAAFLKEKVVSIDIDNDPLWENHKELAGKHKIKACVCYPLSDPYQKVVGTFAVYLQSARALSTAEEATLQRAKYILLHIMDNYNAEEAIKVSEEKYRELFHLHPVPLWLFDTETYTFLDVNEAAIRNYGYSRAEFLSMTIRDIRPGEDQEHLDQTLLDSKASGAYSFGMFRHKKKNGELIYAEIKSNEIEFNGRKARLILATDVTEKVKAERALKLSEHRFKALVQEGSDLISIIGIDGTYKYASPALTVMIGLDTDGIDGINAFDFIHPDDREIITQALSEILTSKRKQTPPFRFKDYNGEYHWLQSIGTNLLNDPAVEGIVVNSKDITDSINHIKAIEEQNEKLRDIAWMQSHIVRAPVSRIMGLVDLITNYPEHKPDNSELLGHIVTSANELDDIIRTIVKKTEQVDLK